MINESTGEFDQNPTVITFVSNNRRCYVTYSSQMIYNRSDSLLYTLSYQTWGYNSLRRRDLAMVYDPAQTGEARYTRFSFASPEDWFGAFYFS